VDEAIIALTSGLFHEADKPISDRNRESLSTIAIWNTDSNH